MTRRQTVIVALVIFFGWLLTAVGSKDSKPFLVAIWKRKPASSAGETATGAEGRLLLRSEVGLQPRIHITDEARNLQIRSSHGETLTVAAVMQAPRGAEENALAEEPLVQFTRESDGHFRLTSLSPAGRPVSRAFLIVVPTGTRLSLDKIGGSAVVKGPLDGLDLKATGCEILIHNVENGVRAAVRSSTIQVDACAGTAVISCDNGKLNLTHHSGDAEITAAFSDALVTHVTGRVKAKTRYGTASGIDLSGPVTIMSDQTSVTLRDVTGDVHLSARGRPVRFRDVTGPATIDAVQCPVAVTGCSGDLTVRISRERLLIADHTGGRIDVEGVQAAVVVRASAGPITVQSTRKPIIMDACTGQMELKNTEGDVHVHPVAAAASAARVSTLNGNAFLYLPEAPSQTVTARAVGGTITGTPPELPAPVATLVGPRMMWSIQGTVGAGANSLNLSTENGGIQFLPSGRIGLVIKSYSAPRG